MPKQSPPSSTELTATAIAIVDGTCMGVIVPAVVPPPHHHLALNVQFSNHPHHFLIRVGVKTLGDGGNNQSSNLGFRPKGSISNFRFKHGELQQQLELNMQSDQAGDVMLASILQL
ncbi:hypothetical protein R6Q59_001822 [Mikania micrantha]